MNKMIWLFILIMSISCASNTKTVTPTKVITTGWSDDDTYTVQATEKNENDAIKSAHHTILKDIVNVRVRNNSRYTDIVKIRDEFDIPLRNGTIIKRLQNTDELTIYYQIRDKDLKKKFQRQ